MLSSINQRKKNDSPSTMQLEQLESRVMLSSVEIFAAGQTGQENLDLFIDGQFVTTFNDVGGDVGSRDFVKLTFNTDEVVTPGRIGVAFGNDFFDPQTGEDRNLLVDRIVVDGVTVQTEDPSTFSTGIFRGGPTGPGNFQTELFNINAIFSFADPDTPVGQGDLVSFDAVGTTGEEIVELVINDEVVSTFFLFNAGVTNSFSFSAQGDVAIEDVRIQFVNDLFDPANGIDRNVQIFGFQVIDSQTGNPSEALTTDANVLSTGIFVPGVGITSGFGAGGFLAGNGSVQQVNSQTGLTATIDMSFQRTALESIETAVGQNNQVATVDFLGNLFLVDDAGIPISTFGNNGSVNVTELLGDRLGSLENRNLLYDDLEFFADGSILVTGAVSTGSTGATFDPVIVKLNADGSLDESFRQQGVLQGTFLQLFSLNNNVKSVVDNAGRVLILGTNSPSPFETNYIVSRLNSDGTLDTTFGNGGNVFISDADVGIVGPTLVSDIEFTSNNQVVFGVGSGDSIVLGKLNEDGSRDSTFGNNGLTTVSVNNFPDFTLDSQDRIVVAGNIGGFASSPTFPLLSRLTANGQIDNSFGENGFIVLEPDDSIASLGVDTGTNFNIPFSLFASGLAVDSADNIVVPANARAPDGSSLLVLQRVLAEGQVDQSFGLAGASVLQSSDGVSGSVRDVIFDSADRLVVGGVNSFDDSGGIARVEFV